MALPCALFALLLFAPQQDFLADGLKALDANQPAAAEPLLRHAVEVTPGDYAAHFNLALALSLQQKDTEAIGEYRRTLELKPALYQADLNLGMLLLRNKHPDEAVPVLKEALGAAGNTAQQNARVTLYYAQALFDSGDAANAETQFRAALQLDPTSAAAQSGLAHVLLTESKLPEAAEHFREAAARDARYRDGLLELAAGYETARMLPEAIAVYREFPENAAAVQRVTSLLAENRLVLADTYKQNKQPERVIEQLQLAVASEPSNYDLRMDLGRELRDAHKAPEAAQQFTAAAKLRPDSVKAWNELATLYVVNADYVSGLAALDRVRALGKEVPGDFYFRAICLERLKQLKPAVEAYKQFLATDGGKMSDQEFLARQRIRIIESELARR